MNTFILDTNIVVSGLKSKSGASYRLLSMFLEGKMEVALSLPLYREYWEVTERDSLGINPEIRESVLIAFSKYSLPINISFRWRPFLRDEADNMVLETAVAANADIVTHNVKDFVEVPQKFNVRVLKPQEVLNECR